MTFQSLLKNWTTWTALILIPLFPGCFATSWPVPAHQAVTDHGTSQLIPLYIPDYLKDNRAPSPYLYQPSPGSVISQFVALLPSQEHGLGFRLVSEPSNSGTFCTLHLSIQEPSMATQLASLLSILTYFLIPTYTDSMTYELTYDLFSDTHFVRQYRYHVQGKRLIWVFMPFALPFMSGHWEPTINPQTQVSDSLMQGLLSSLAQLRVAGQRDGLFR